MKRLAAVLPAVAAVLSAFSARAEERPLGLAEALALASGRNPDVLAVQAHSEAAAARAQAARRRSWPRLSLSGDWSRSDNPALVFAQKLDAAEFSAEDFALGRLNAPEALSHQTTVLSLELPVDAFGKIRSSAEAQAAAAGAAQAVTRRSLQDLRLRVAEAYRRAALARRALEVSERALRGARSREADLEARVEAGGALRAELLRARARRRAREADLVQARNDAQVAQAVLGRLLGAEPGVVYRPTDEAPRPGALEGDEEDWVRQGLARRPELEATRKREDAARWAARAERRGALPDLAVWGRLQDDRSSLGGGNRTGAFGVGLRWSVFEAGRAKRQGAAEAEARAAEQEARAARDQARLEIQTAWRRAQAARERYAAAGGGAEEGREALRVVQERRQAGLATLTDELETETAALGAELEELRAATEVALADAALAHAAGEP